MMTTTWTYLLSSDRLLTLEMYNTTAAIKKKNVDRDCGATYVHETCVQRLSILPH